MVKNEEGLGAVVEKYLRRYYAASKETEAMADVYDFVITEVERRLITVTLEATGGNRLKAAKVLGINRNTLLRKIRQFGLDENMMPKESAKTEKKRRNA